MRAAAVVGKVRRRALPSTPYFATDGVQVGANVRFGRNVQFLGQRVRIGDGVTFGDDVRVEAVNFPIGNYGTIYPGCYFPGGTVSIGHNFWLGYGSIVDGNAGTTIGDNVGIGAQSQLWTHMAFGDTLAGCRFDSGKPLQIGNDVWFVGHCLVSPITAGDRSLAMLGSVVVKDMLTDRTYAGSPATDMTDRFGAQFAERPLGERIDDLNQRLDTLLPVREDRRLVVAVTNETAEEWRRYYGLLLLNVETRTHSVAHPLEHRVLRGLLPWAKFTPAQ